MVDVKKPAFVSANIEAKFSESYISPEKLFKVILGETEVKTQIVRS